MIMWHKATEKPKAEQIVVGYWCGEEIDHTDLCYYDKGRWYSVSPGISEPQREPTYWTEAPDEE
jgi:hypothetical protein